jgi:hypothetical protein
MRSLFVVLVITAFSSATSRSPQAFALRGDASVDRADDALGKTLDFLLRHSEGVKRSWLGSWPAVALRGFGCSARYPCVRLVR